MSRMLRPFGSGPEALAKKRRIFCATHGHSRLRDFFFGYHYCARCGDTLGDSLGSMYSDSEAVFIHHMYLWTAEGKRANGCTCPENAKNLRRKDFAHVQKYNSLGYPMRPPWDKRAPEQSK